MVDPRHTDDDDPTRGIGGWPLFSDHVETWAWRNGVFTDDELDSIIDMGAQTELKKASVYSSHGSLEDDSVRNSFVSFFYPNKRTEFVFQRLTTLIHDTNSTYFKFDLSSIEQGLQFTRYSAPGQHYDWHIDRDYNMTTRKLSVVIQLNSPDDYSGGDLELMLGATPTSIPKQRGLITFFPSYTLHRVLPVTDGTRYSLVCWVNGPPFK
jgi:PKHD-type hydroxylase